MPKDTLDNDAWIDKVLNTHRTETWSTGWNNKATDEAKATIQQHLKQAEAKARKPYEDKLAQWLQPELMQDFVIDYMNLEELKQTAKRYAQWLLELDSLAQLQQQLNKGDK